MTQTDVEHDDDTPTALPIAGTVSSDDDQPGDFDFLAHYGEDDDATFVCRATRPKMYVLLKVAAILGDENVVAQAAGLDRLLDKIVTEETATYLRERWEDDDDKLDVLWLTVFVPQAIGRWFGDPTGAVSGSRSSRKRTGGSSTARRH